MRTITMTTENDSPGGQPPPRGPKTFIQTLGDLEFGHFADECTERLREAIQAVAAREKGASITIKLDMKPGAGGQVDISADVSVKLPKPKKGTTLMFISPELNLVRNDPRQQQLPGIRVVDKDTEQQPAAIRVA
jgi:hypothetical protein